jgi:predicted alpha/beta-fold hydrolase
MTRNTQVRWAFRNGIWVMGVDSIPEVARAFAKYTLEGVADKIVTPALVLDAENDQFLKGQPQKAVDAMVNAPTTLISLPEAEGAGEHCHMGAMSRLHQTIFDWLDETLKKTD